MTTLHGHPLGLGRDGRLHACELHWPDDWGLIAVCGHGRDAKRKWSVVNWMFAGLGSGASGQYVGWVRSDRKLRRPPKSHRPICRRCWCMTQGRRR